MGTGVASIDWDRRYARVLVVVPWLLLVPSVAINQATPDQAAGVRAGTLALAALAAAWVYGWHTRPRRERWERWWPGAVYMAGLLALCAALMAYDVIYVLFTITAFFHAYQLKPWPLGVAGVLVTSVVLNTMTMGAPEATPASLGGYLGVIIVQSAAIGAGIVFGEKASEQQRRRDEMVARLEAALEENAGLHAQLLTQAREAGVLDERQRMAREIHDTLAQGLAGIITQVQAAQRVWPEPARARPHVDRALALAKESLTEARRSVQALQPRELEEARLPDAVADLARRWSNETGVEPSVEITGEPVPLSPAIEVALFRVAQEALTNVAKHASAARVGLTLSYLGDVVLLDVRDDGVGMRDADSGGFGLNSMRQRIRGIGGAVTVESAPGEGTAVSVSVPMMSVGAP
ncbi:histidine kinase [Phytohabitans aurantiacus]|uniref:Oxygen sensor histidine kinase NreB n=1 Tax=Phytohabitans aurantiacus TaxID=3016789 RepID=A0ABQ5R3R1_9ACTN|nr:histidine kinase [Phytohabitans aurantiacus]